MRDQYPGREVAAAAGLQDQFLGTATLKGMDKEEEEAAVVAVVEREIPEVPEAPEALQTLQRITVYL